MAWTITAKGTNGNYTGTAATSVAVTGITGLAAGDALAVFVQNGLTNAPTISDNLGGNTYTAAISNVTNTNGQQMWCFYCANLANAPSTITATTIASGLAAYNIGIVQIRNSVGAGIIFHASTSASGSSAAPTATATFTAGDVTIGAGWGGSQGGQGWAAGTNNTLQNHPNAYDYADASNITTGTTAFTIISEGWGVVVMTFSPPSAAPACSHSLMRIGFGCAVVAARKLEENPVLTRRRLLVARLGRS